MARKKAQEEPPNPLGWMVTFSDLVTLLLTFFVLLISMSSMDVKSVQMAFGNFFSGGTGPLDFASQGRLEELARFLEKAEQVPPNVLIQQEEIKETIFEFEDLEYKKLVELVERDITITRENRGLVIRMADYILFHEGGAVIRREYVPILSRLGDFLRVTRRSISVEGHTDDSLLEGQGDSWSWELSLNRALAVMDYFVHEEGIVEERFRVGGFGATRPLVPNDSAKNRAKNRRIEIILYRETY